MSDVSNGREKTPEFDCSGGLRLSDSGSDSDDEPSTSSKGLVTNGNNHANSIDQTSGSKSVDLRHIHDNLQEMEKAKMNLINYTNRKKAASDSQKENINIADLLALGETTAEPSTSKKKTSQKRARNTQADDSDSDGWEEVEGKRIKRPRYLKTLKKFEYEC